MKKFFGRFWVFIPLILAAAMYFLLPLFPSFTEYVISRGLNKIITVPLGFLTSLIPVSLTEWLLILSVPIIIFLIVLLVVKLRKSEKKSRTLLGAGKFLAGFISITSFLYMTCHGANYYRYPLERNMGLDTSHRSQEELQRVCIILAQGAAQARAELNVPEDAEFEFSESIYTELTRAGSGYSALTDEYPFLWTSIWRQKPVMLSEQWSYTFIVGMYFPMLAECNINTVQPDYCIPFTAAHESAHSRGIAFENECNFLAFLSCINSEYPEYRYSGYMEALSYCRRDLDSEYRKEVNEYITDGMWADYAASNRFLDDHRKEIKIGSTEISVSEVSSQVNDNFIKSQGVEEGVRSYNQVTDLILAYYGSKE